MKLIIITGAPATGKSSVAETLSTETGIPHISKDAFKIELFEKYGFNNHDEKKKLSIEGETILLENIRKYITSDKDVIVDNNFKDFDKVREILADYPGKYCVICIVLYTDYSVLAERYNHRITSGNRHAALYTLNKYPVVDGISEFHPVITEQDVDNIQNNVREKSFGENVLNVDTSDIENSYKDICKKITDYINSF